MRANKGVMKRRTRRTAVKRGEARVGYIKEMGTYNQTGGRKSIKADRARKAMKPGYRISSSGNLYRETRKNRSDSKNRI